VEAAHEPASLAGGLLGYLTVQDFSFIQLKQAGGARVPVYVATFILAVAFY